MPASFSPPRTTATPPSTGSLPPTLSLGAEQQLGFPAGAAASTSSLDTAGPTVPCIPTPRRRRQQAGAVRTKMDK